MSRGVFVLGMHRSGTSAAARLVTLLGVPTCRADDLLAATPDNPRGHWESASLAACNDRLLDALGCDWTCPPRLEAGWSGEPGLDGLRAEARELFGWAMPSGQWVWKDPRNCVTFPFWKTCIEVAPVVVLVHREPLEIAASLAARNGFSKPYALALWERYLRLCLEAIGGLPVLVSRYGELVDDPLAWCLQARTFLDEIGVVTEAPPEEEVLAFVDAGLRHQRRASCELEADPAALPEQRELSRELTRLVGAQGAFVAPTLPDETPTTEALLAERRRAHIVESELRAQYEELEEYTRRLAERLVVHEAEIAGSERGSDG